MSVCTVLQKSDGAVVGAELTCSVREENKAMKESYSADWQSVSFKTRPHDRQTMNMNDTSRRETLSRQWRARTLFQTCPSGVVRMGTVETGVREHQLLPKRNTLPLPIFTPTELGVRFGRGAPHTEADLYPYVVPDGVCPTKRSVDEITKDLPPVKPGLMERALGRSVSQDAQRG
ncbi:telethonin [Eucyclogobius newberryi]|uniref:telethonin n=1 Tax=Eucyclogobius newberryi TaxID=166745 RepID=UPI003B5C2162